MPGLDQHRVTGRQQAAQQIQVAADTGQGSQLGKLFHIGDHLGWHDVFVIHFQVGSQVAARIALVALPAPIRERHRQVGRTAVIELLVLVHNPAQQYFARQRRGGRRGRKGGRRAAPGVTAAVGLWIIWGDLPCLRRLAGSRWSGGLWRVQHIQGGFGDGLHQARLSCPTRNKDQSFRRIQYALDLRLHVCQPPGQPFMHRRRLVNQKSRQAKYKQTNQRYE